MNQSDDDCGRRRIENSPVADSIYNCATMYSYNRYLPTLFFCAHEGLDRHSIAVRRIQCAETFSFLFERRPDVAGRSVTNRQLRGQTAGRG